MSRLSALLSDVDGVFRTVPKAYLCECVVEALLPHVRAARELDADFVWALSGSDAFVNETPDFLEFAAFAADDTPENRLRLREKSGDAGFLRAYLAESKRAEPFAGLPDAIARFHELRHGPAGQRTMAPIGGALDGLRMVLDAGLPFALVSNSPKKSIQTWFSAHGFPRLVILGEEDVIRQKPDPQGIATACQKLGVAPSKEVGYAGDLPNDVFAAKSAGVSALGIAYDDRRERLRKAGPDFLFPDFQACAQWVLDGKTA